MGRLGLERVHGIEPRSSAWKAAALPLCYTRSEARQLAILAAPIKSFVQSIVGASQRGGYPGFRLRSCIARLDLIYRIQSFAAANHQAMVEGTGFEPVYAKRPDLQSGGFNHSPTPPGCRADPTI